MCFTVVYLTERLPSAVSAHFVVVDFLSVASKSSLLVRPTHWTLDKVGIPVVSVLCLYDCGHLSVFSMVGS